MDWMLLAASDMLTAAGLLRVLHGENVQPKWNVTWKKNSEKRLLSAEPLHLKPLREWMLKK